MDKEGLAVTVMTNILDTPSGSVMMTDKAAGMAVDNIFGKKAGAKIRKAFVNLHLDPKNKTGQYVMNAFGAIDSQSRFSLAMDYMVKRGWKPGTEIDRKLMTEAIDESNKIYGDLDLVTAKWVNAIQTYGLVPFANWFMRASYGIYESAKRHPKEAIAIALGLYAVQEMTDKRTGSWSPIATMAETPMDMVSMSPYSEPSRSLKAATEPAV
jgi:hypothetical protein